MYWFAWLGVATMLVGTLLGVEWIIVNWSEAFLVSDIVGTSVSILVALGSLAILAWVIGQE